MKCYITILQPIMQKAKKISIEGLKSRIITVKDDIITVLNLALKNAGSESSLQDGDILVITSKVVAITQGRIAKISKPGDFEKLVKAEADKVIGGNAVTLTLKNNIFIPWAGIDRSNIQKGWVVLWPKEPYKAADQICKTLKKNYKLKRLGIIISDSICTPLRRGVSAVALGYAGFKGVNDLRGNKDLHGNKLKVTQQGIADMLAVSAHLVMGESNEATPFALIRGVGDGRKAGAKVQFTNKKIDPKEAIIDIEQCLFRPLYKTKS